MRNFYSFVIINLFWGRTCRFLLRLHVLLYNARLMLMFLANKEIIFEQIKLENERNLISQSIPNCNLENNHENSRFMYAFKLKFLFMLLLWNIELFKLAKRYKSISCLISFFKGKIVWNIVIFQLAKFKKKNLFFIFFRDRSYENRDISISQI